MNGKISNMLQIAGIRRYTLSEGPSAGLKVIDCDNGIIRFLLNESKALDVMQVYYRGQNMSFVSKNGFTLRDIAFERRMEGGMLYTCGVDSVGSRAGCETHGTLHGTPALVTRAECGEDGILIEAEISLTQLFGKNLLLKRKIFAPLGISRLEISDCLQNCGYSEEEYCLLYHVNLGYPMLDEGAKIVGTVQEAIPRTPWAAECLEQRDLITSPIAKQEETCYYLSVPDARLSLVNEKLGRSFTLSWSAETLPHCIEWKSMASGDYALGIEPATTKLDEHFRMKKLQAGTSAAFSLRMEFHELK